MKKEKTNIYNVTFNKKTSTPIKTDLEAIEDAIINEVIMYVKGYHNINRDKGLGAEHIKIHLEPNSIGEVDINELLNLGNSIREYLKIFKKPYIDKGGKIYEWEDRNGVRFRAVVNKIPKKHIGKIQNSYQKGGPQLPLSPLDDMIITFYSDRNLNERMSFKNKEVDVYYKEINKNLDSRALTSNTSLDSNPSSALKYFRSINKPQNNIVDSKNNISRVKKK